MIGWHHQLDGHEFGVRQGSLACYSPWGCKELDTTERLNNNVHQQAEQYMHRGNLRKRRARKAESLFEEIMVKNFPNLRNKMDIQTQEI